MFGKSLCLRPLLSLDASCTWMTGNMKGIEGHIAQRTSATEMQVLRVLSAHSEEGHPSSVSLHRASICEVKA